MKRTWITGMVSGLSLALMGPPREPSNQEINDAFVQQIPKQIAGHEQDPSGQVFKNIQVDFLKKVPAGRLL